MKKNEILLGIEVKLLFISTDSLNKQFLKLKLELKKNFENIIVHYDLSDEQTDSGLNCIGIRVELFKYVENKLNGKRAIWKDAANILNKYSLVDYKITDQKS